jgi:CO dehydrogenase/acetyl-CoA synthase beta subunit
MLFFSYFQESCLRPCGGEGSLHLGDALLEEAVSSFLHLCFVANIRYPVGTGIVCTYLQRYAAKLDENGTTAAMKKKDQVDPEDKVMRSFKKVFDEFRQKMYDILSSHAVISDK